MTYNMDRLYEAVAARGHVCVGLDTSPAYVPRAEMLRADSPAAAVLAYNRALIDATCDVAACYKVQIAYYEELGLAGLEAYAGTLDYIRGRGALSIADIKRGDIADTAARYAKAHFSGDFEADFVTLSPYMGMDSIEPWLSWADARGKGAFVLMRTSNKGMRDFEYRELKSGGRLYDAVGERLLAAASRGRYGYGVFGAVVGADPKSGAEREEAAAIRETYSGLFFLIPGYGAQGGAAKDAALLLREGNGGVVNASRSILRAWMFDGASEAAAPCTADDRLAANRIVTTRMADNRFAAQAARNAAVAMRDAIRAACGAGK